MGADTLQALIDGQTIVGFIHPDEWIGSPVRNPDGTAGVTTTADFDQCIMVRATRAHVGLAITEGTVMALKKQYAIPDGWEELPA